MTRTLVIGANGTVGSELVKLLAARGQTVLQATSRAPSQAGQVQVDVLSGAGVAQAFAQADHAFLLEGGVFTPDLIETWIEYKRTQEVDPIRLRPHPHEFELYYDI